jgi:hypothetical protein
MKTPRIQARGATITTGGTSASVAIPNMAAGSAPFRLRLAATAACYARLGLASEASVVPSAAGTGYVPGDSITLAGGTGTDPMKLSVTHTQLASAAVNAIGAGYAVNDVLTLAGGTAVVEAAATVASLQLASAGVNAPGTGYVPAQVATLLGGTLTTAAQVTVLTTKVVSATVNAGGSGGANGAGVIVQGTTGTGTKFQASVTITAGAIASVQSITLAGSYSANPTVIGQEPVTLVSGGAGLTGAKLAVVMGVDTFSITTRGNYSVGATTFTQNGATVPSGGTGLTLNAGLFGVRTFTVSAAGDYTANAAALTQDGAANPPGGTGATFNTLVYGVKTVSVLDAGTYTVDPSNPVAQASTSGAGTSATFTVTPVTAAAAGDMLITPNEAVIVDAQGFGHVAAIQVTGAGILQISPLEP